MTAHHPQDPSTGVDTAFEAPDADTAEQRADVLADTDGPDRDDAPGFADDVPEADAVEQHQTVGGDPDEYR